MNRLQKQIIKDALDDPEKLTEWENGFIDDMADKPDDFEATIKQNTALNRIGSKVA